MIRHGLLGSARAGIAAVAIVTSVIGHVSTATAERAPVVRSSLATPNRSVLGMPPPAGHGKFYVILKGRTAWIEQHEAPPTFVSTRGQRRTKVYTSHGERAGAEASLARLVEHLGVTAVAQPR